ncbi:sulfatase family protein [Rubritalea marina]|uniref:sulfatase family protein n=1 Tax=Rubritalea marina TaxID=361055 RepID=UPI00036180BE|nr:sulfatase [Rubritalea marina]
MKLKIYLKHIAYLVSATIIGTATLSAADSRPNVVVILSDDQSWADYGFMGHPEIQTPHLDQLADESLVFEHGYVASPLCRPSLASIVTGRQVFEHGITGNDVRLAKKRDILDRPMREKFHQLPSFVKSLREAGYISHQSGKWWEGSYQDGGFTYGMTHADPERGGRHGDDGLKIGREGMEPIRDFVDQAVEEQKPFLVWYAPFLPHTPHNPPKRLLDKYSKPGREEDVAKYYAMCDWFDETCGELVQILEDKEVRDNTIILYICDNGWLPKSMNQDDPNQKLWRGDFAQRTKTSPFENGIRTPIMVSWPGHVKPERSPDLAHAIDLYPTIAAAAGFEAPKELKGINLMDAQARAERDIVFGCAHASHNIDTEQSHNTLQYLWAVEGDWKLIMRFQGEDLTIYKVLHTWDKEPFRLYNIKSDPHEKNNLANEHPEKVEALRKKIEAWYPAQG